MVRYWDMRQLQLIQSHTYITHNSSRCWNISIFFVLSWLIKFFVSRWWHFVLKSSQDSFNCIFLVPTLQKSEFRGIDLLSYKQEPKLLFLSSDQHWEDWFYSQISLLEQLWGSHFHSKSSMSIFFRREQSMDHSTFEFVLQRGQEWFRSSMWRSYPQLWYEIMKYPIPLSRP
jgi:hypothetical protein